MGLGEATLKLLMLGEDRTAGKTITGVGDKAEKTSGHLRNMGKIAAGVFAGGALVGGAVAAGKAFVSMGKNAMEDAAASRRLAVALKNTTGATKDQVAGVENWISKQGVALGVTDDELRPALQRLAQSTGDIGKAQKLTSLAMDASAGSGKSLKVVTEALAKANAGNMGALSKLGVRIKDVHGKTMSFDQVTQQMAKTFHGQAAAAADSASGKFDRLKLIFDETKESIGYKLIPIALALANFFLNKVVPAVQMLGAKFSEFQARAKAAFEGSRGDIAKNVENIRATISSFVDIVRVLWARFGGFIEDYVIHTFQNVKTILSGAFTVIAGIFKTVSALLHGDWKGVWDGIKQILRGSLQILHGLLSQGMNLLKLMWRVGWSALKGILGGIWDGIKGLVAAGISGLVAQVKSIPGRLKQLLGLFRDAGKYLIQGFVNGIKNAPGVIGGIAGNVWEAVKSLLNGAITKINKALEFKISLPGPDIHVNVPDIPKLAKGGIVKARPGGTLAILGEDGEDEIVTPLSQALRGATYVGSRPASGGTVGAGVPAGGGDLGTLTLLVKSADTGEVIEQKLIQVNRTSGRKLQFKVAG